MRSLSTARPIFLDYFPRTRRGHGSTHPEPRVKDGIRKRNAGACAMQTCGRNMRKGGEEHIDVKANVDDWKDERGLLVIQGKARFGKEKRKVEPYKPAPRAVVPETPKRSDKCECGHKPTGKQGDEGLTLGLCGRCWKRGYSKKLVQADEGGKVAA
jgi:hypothetical protein